MRRATSSFGPDSVATTAPDRVENLHSVVRRADRRHAVDDDQIAMLLLQLGHRPQMMVFRFQRKADEPLAQPAVGGDRRDDVGRFVQFQLQQTARLANLPRLDVRRPIVARGGNADQPIATAENARGRRPAFRRSKRRESLPPPPDM